MPSQAPLPRLLTPYLSPANFSLTVITNVLGATSNWLILRFLLSALSSGRTPTASAPVESFPLNSLDGSGTGYNHTDSISDGRKVVVLVSFLRSWEFWRVEAKRLVSS